MGITGSQTVLSPKANRSTKDEGRGERKKKRGGGRRGRGGRMTILSSTMHTE